MKNSEWKAFLRNLIRPTMLFMLAAGTASGCGLKGDLYLEEAPAEAATEADEEANENAAAD